MKLSTEETTPKYETFCSTVIRAGKYSGFSECCDELEALDKLGKNYPDFPFSFLIGLDTVSNKYAKVISSKVDRKMDVDYRNNTALIITITLYDEEFPHSTTLSSPFSIEEYKTRKTPDENIEFARKILGQELMQHFPLFLKKQFKNYPIIKGMYDDFIVDFENILREIKWIQ